MTTRFISSLEKVFPYVSFIRGNPGDDIKYIFIEGFDGKNHFHITEKNGRVYLNQYYFCDSDTDEVILEKLIETITSMMN
ncbi:hypothetical protein BNJ_00192 [Kaumoebavirus]|uniref:hypothetical protein n=1 Tax=Kaumoebavirus TaxID=1859492 RepID=UPI0009C202C0|nr:hypothetical protein BNJ_00192 [Kaumoebavirus]ARA72023.1 hypothetical protein BNJ_00192 [Kaumoebavirus]